MASRVLLQPAHKLLLASHKLYARQALQPLVKMSQKKEHLDLTSDQYRVGVQNQITKHYDPGATAAQVVAITQLSSTVKGLTLQVKEKQTSDLHFHAGQWLDFFIPEEEKVGGFSMCSSPTDLAKNGTVDLAVKFSTWAPANWVHTQCKVGDLVTFRFGGDFYYPSNGLDDDHSLLLVAGGVGINPLYSIWLQAAHLARTEAGTSPTSVSLLYSAATTGELLFSDKIDQVEEEMKQFTSKYFVTKDRDFTRGETKRISKTDLEQELKKKEKRTICYLCGPPGMVDQVNVWLVELGVKKEDIRFELWW